MSKKLSLMLVGALLGAIMLSPASAHFRPKIPHIKQHMKKFFYTKAQANARFAEKGTAFTKAETDQRINTLRFEPVPSGTTIRGAVGADFHAENAPERDFGVDVSLPVPAANPISDDEVSINVTGWVSGNGQTQPTTTDTNPGCTGTPANPTAPAGHVCIYVAGGDNAVNVDGFSVLPGTGASPYGFKLGWDVAAPGDTFIDAVWAYTAP
jgi:hypothetical protein